MVQRLDREVDVLFSWRVIQAIHIRNEDGIPFQIFHGVSNNARAFWSIATRAGRSATNRRTIQSVYSLTTYVRISTPTGGRCRLAQRLRHREEPVLGGRVQNNE
jgi:hypothetical protein